MLSLTAVALVLGSYGMEPSREMKFRGVLVAQADIAPLASQELEPNTTELAQKPIDLERPGITASVVLSTVFRTLFVTAASAAIVGGIAWGVFGAYGFVTFGLMFLGAVVGGVALIPFVIGLVMLPGQLKNRANSDRLKSKTLGHESADAPRGAVIASF